MFEFPINFNKIIIEFDINFNKIIYRNFTLNLCDLSKFVINVNNLNNLHQLKVKLRLIKLRNILPKYYMIKF